MRDLQDYENKYVDMPFEKFQVDYRRKNVINIMKKYMHSNIIEIGCGMQPLFNYFHSFNNMLVIEPCDKFYKNALKLSKGYSNVEINCVWSTLEEYVESNIPLNADYIIVSSLLHEVENSFSLLHSIKKLCNEDSVVHINVPNANSFHRILAVEMGLIENIYEKSDNQKKMQQNCVYNLASLIKECEEVGFQIIEQGSYFIKPFTHRQMQSCFDANIFDVNLLNGLDRMIKYFPEYGSEIFVQCKSPVR